MFSAKQMQNVLRQNPSAKALIVGGESNPDISGWVNFYQMSGGVLVVTEVKGLPYGSLPCGSRVFGFHIHEGTSCSGTAEDQFADTGAHYNPSGCEHPEHAGDLPPLFGNAGYAFMSVFTDRFSVAEIVGRTIIIHDSPDDFTTQPSGNSGKKIACGKIAINGYFRR